MFQQPEQKSFHSDDDFHSGCRNISHHNWEQSFSDLHSPRQSLNLNVSYTDKSIENLHNFVITTIQLKMLLLWKCVE